MTFIERPSQLNGRVTFWSVPNSIFHCFVLTALNTRCKLTIRLTLKLFYHNAQYLEGGGGGRDRLESTIRKEITETRRLLRRSLRLPKRKWAQGGLS